MNLHDESKKLVSFQKRKEKRPTLYIGSTNYDNKNFLEKIGKSYNPYKRQKDHNCGNSPLNAFHMRHIYNTPIDLANSTESYIHSILKPLHCYNKDYSVKETYMIHTKIADFIIKQILRDQDKYIQWVNQYLDYLKYYNYNYKQLDSIFENEDLTNIFSHKIIPLPIDTKNHPLKMNKKRKYDIFIENNFYFYNESTHQYNTRSKKIKLK
jgi:hypothetical protein